MKLNRLSRAAIGLVAVIVGYAVYSRLAVPWLEPDRPKTHIAEKTTTPERVQAAPFRQKIAGYFPDNSWEAQDSKILKSEHIALLFKEYEPTENGSILIHPCTVVMLPKTPDKSPLILQAPSGAIMQFDRPLNLMTATVGNPVAGRLRGDVRVSSPGDQDGNGKLEILANTLQIDTERIWTPNVVEFRYGQSHGRGRELTINLAEVGPSAGQQPRFAAIQSIKLSQLDKLVLYPASAQIANPIANNEGSAGALPANLTADLTAGSSTSSANLDAESRTRTESKNVHPLEVTCRGSCQLDFTRQQFSFRDRVELRQASANKGLTDSLTCDLLVMDFLTVDESGTVGGPTRTSPLNAKQKLPKLRVQRITAEGNPAVLKAPSKFTYLRGNKLVYDLDGERFHVESSDQAQLQFNKGTSRHEIVAREFDYAHAGKGQIGRVVSNGPGFYRGTFSGDQRSVECRWNESMVLERESQLHVLKVRGNVATEVVQDGRLTADQVSVWFEDAPQRLIDRASDLPNLRPKRCEASGRVEFFSPKMTASCESLVANFSHLATVAGKQQSSSFVTQPVSLRGDRSSAGSSELGRMPADNSDRSFAVTGREIDLQLVLNGQKLGEVRQIDVRGNATLRETGEPRDENEVGLQRLSIGADSFRAIRPNSEAATVLAVGRPTRIIAGGMELRAGNLNVDRQTNKVWANGGGTARVLLTEDLEGRKLDTPTEATIVWHRGLSFDGQQILFDGQVRVDGPNLEISCEQIQARLDRFIGFTDANSIKGKPQVIWLRATGNVRAMQRSMENGRREGETFFYGPDVVFDRESGGVEVAGRGRMITLQKGFNGQLGAINSNHSSGRSGGDPRGPRDESLTFLQIDFDAGMKGNVYSKQLEFDRRVRTIYGPVFDWDQQIDIKQPLGENDIIATCDKLIVSQQQQAGSARPTGDLQAIGNAYIQGKTFTARGDRVTFDQAKDMMVLKGTGNRDAVISFQKRPNEARTEEAGREFRFFPGSRRIEFIDQRYLDFRTFGR